MYFVGGGPLHLKVSFGLSREATGKASALERAARQLEALGAGQVPVRTSRRVGTRVCRNTYRKWPPKHPTKSCFPVTCSATQPFEPPEKGIPVMASTIRRTPNWLEFRPQRTDIPYVVQKGSGTDPGPASQKFPCTQPIGSLQNFGKGCP